MRRILCVIAIVCLLGGCASQPDNVYTCKDLTLTLPGVFEDLSGEPYGKDADFLLGQDKLSVMGLAEKKADLPGLSLKDYTALVLQGNGLTCKAQEMGSGYLFSYEAPVEEEIYTYETVTLETGNYFWVIQCYCPADHYRMLEPLIAGILANVSAEN